MKVNEREKSHNQYESDQMKSSEYGGVGESGTPDERQDYSLSVVLHTALHNRIKFFMKKCQNWNFVI